MLKHILPILLLLLMVPLGLSAQYDAIFSHYWAMEPSFNPAAVGKDSKLSVVGAYALDFAGFDHNPQTAYIGADLPLYFFKSYHGAGASFMNDKIGLFTHRRMAGQYAFKFRLLKGTMSIGLQAGLLMEDFDGSKLDLEDSSDPAFTSSQVSGNAFDAAFGIYYSHNRWYVGVSGQHLTAPTVHLGETNELKIDRTYYLTGGYNIKLRNPFLNIPVSVIARYDGSAYRADITGRVVYHNEKKTMYAGVTYSPTNSVTAIIGGSFHGINLGYSYEMYTSAVSPGNGSHGLFVGYQTDINLLKKGRNKHKSVRFL